MNSLEIPSYKYKGSGFEKPNQNSTNVLANLKVYFVNVHLTDAHATLLENEMRSFIENGEISTMEFYRKLRSQFELLQRPITAQDIQRWGAIRILKPQLSTQVPNVPRNRRGAMWTTKQNQACKMHFKDFYRTGKFPSTFYIRDVCKKIPCLNNRSPRKIKAHLQFEMKKKQ